MLIALDFDDTLTADSKLWENFVADAKRLGHRVICVTARRGTPENCETVENWMVMHGVRLPVYYTALCSKVEHMKKLGVQVDIWIDDNPHACAMGH